MGGKEGKQAFSTMLRNLAHMANDASAATEMVAENINRFTRDFSSGGW